MSDDLDDVSCDTKDTVDRILDAYSFSFEPTWRLKWSARLPQTSMSLSYCKPWSRDWCWRIGIKPHSDTLLGGHLHRVILEPQTGHVCVCTRKIRLGVLRLQFDAHYDFRHRKAHLDYRITTKWSDGHHLSSKLKFQPCPAMLLRAKQHLRWQAPSVEGHLGANEIEEHGDPYGSLDWRIHQVDLKFSL